MARQIHLVRHGEVHNPGGVLYGRLPGFPLSEHGRSTAQGAADELERTGRAIDAVIASPLERAMESAAPIARFAGLAAEPDERVIEAFSRLEGGEYEMSLSILAKPRAWRFLVNPFRPSWGEPYTEVLARMHGAMEDAWTRPGEGDIVIVGHQLPIWVTSRNGRGRSSFHDPRKRRCALSSITTFVRRDGAFIEVGYRDTVAAHGETARDVGAA
ncbi:histidine phosphatase family protein [Agromyces sp. LHK192]|uniref:histidine phosphatase family protein n=1 Tax=Agromyces sp. LHK192 TaxID=2498704 RepID=UPI000FD8528F|nr:histidine phosphatase family protein [Agromyces sp. LHK192]